MKEEENMKMRTKLIRTLMYSKITSSLEKLFSQLSTIKAHLEL